MFFCASRILTIRAKGEVLLVNKCMKLPDTVKSNADSCLWRTRTKNWALVLDSRLNRLSPGSACHQAAGRANTDGTRVGAFTESRFI